MRSSQTKIHLLSKHGAFSVWMSGWLWVYCVPGPSPAPPSLMRRGIRLEAEWEQRRGEERSVSGPGWESRRPQCHAGQWGKMECKVRGDMRPLQVWIEICFVDVIDVLLFHCFTFQHGHPVHVHYTPQPLDSIWSTKKSTLHWKAVVV